MNKLAWIILALIAVLVAHLVEEIKTDFRRKFPLGEMSMPLFIGINGGLYLFCFVTLTLAVLRNSLAVPLAGIFALIMLLNGIGHVGIMAVRGAYFPGGFTAFLLVAISAYLIVTLMING